MSFDLGDTWALAADVRDQNDALTNVESVALTIVKPDRTIDNPAVTNPPAAVGRYEHDYVPAVAGRYAARWLFTFAGGLTAAHTDVLDVRPAEPGLILSLADAKAHLNITSTDNDDELRSWIESVTEVIEHKVGPIVVRTYTDRVDNAEAWVLWNSPVVAITSVTAVHTDGAVIDTALLDIDSTAGIIRRLSRGHFTGGPWNITYTAGRPIIPANIGHAARIILKHLWETQRGGVRRPPMGGDDGTFDAGHSYSIPRRALELLEPHLTGPGMA